MRARWLLVLTAAVAPAQPQPWIDISGEWRLHAGDDLAFARPEFDDSRWSTVRLPGDFRGARQPRGNDDRLWLRKSVVLDGVEDQRLVLSLGKLTENYQVFVNGQLLASIGDFTQEQTQLARPRTFDLPPLHSRRVVIAIRAEARRWLGLSSRWSRAPDTGPYAITGTANAPRDAGTHFLTDMRQRSNSGLIAGVVLLGLSLLPLIVFAYDRTRWELIWLALHAMLVSARRLQVTLFMTPDSTPFASALDIMHIHYVMLLEFVAASLTVKVGWFRVLAWGMVLVAYVHPWRGAYGQSFRVIEVCSVGFFVWAAWSCRGRQKPGHWLILGGALAVFYAGARTDLTQGTPLQYLPLPPGLSSDPHSIVTAIYTLAMILVLTQRLALDRTDKLRLAGDLEAARTVQNLLLTPGEENAGAYAIETVYVPAQEVGGDFYQVLHDSEGGVLVLVGDVSGKGLRAAMVVSMLIGVARTHRRLAPGALLEQMNEALLPGGGGFVTCVALRLTASGDATLANAGHLAPSLNGVEIPVESGLPLGVMSGVRYDDTHFHVGPGLGLTLCTDGVVEAENSERELFGFDRTREISVKSAQEIAEAARAWGQNDDITVVTVRRSS